MKSKRKTVSLPTSTLLTAKVAEYLISIYTDFQINSDGKPLL